MDPDASQGSSPYLTDDLTTRNSGGVFRTHAPIYAAMGIPVFPCANKVPLIAGWRRLGVRGCQQNLNRPKFENAQIGMQCGPMSGVTIIDVDQPGPDALSGAIAKFGDTPLIARTHSGKFHLYFRHNGEGRKINPFKDNIDILGRDGLAILPPSIGKMGSYSWLRGGISELSQKAKLPTVRSEALAALELSPTHLSKAIVTGSDIGHRDIELFNLCRTRARSAESEDELIDFALSQNAKFDPPLPERQAKDKARSAWKYKQLGRLFFKGQDASAVIDSSTFAALVEHPRALQVLIQAKLAHAWKPDIQFALGIDGLARKLRASPGTIMKAIETLIQFGMIERTYKGGRGPGDPSQYRLT